MKEIRQIVALYEQLVEENVPSALAVVLEVEQSSYRRVGARLLVAADGRYVGGISGGCLEGDALKRAKKAILKGEPSVQVYDTTDGEDAVIGVGLGCEGRIKVGFIPLDSTRHNEVRLLAQLLTIREPKVLIRVLTDSPSDRGISRVELFDNRGPLGYAGGMMYDVGEVDYHAQRALDSGRSVVKTVRGERGYPHAVLYEVLHLIIHLVVMGTNYDIPPTLRAAKLLGWTCSVVGARRKITREIAGLADATFDYSEVDKITIDNATAIALMSHDYDWDRRMVQHFVPLKPRYFGMLGPRKRMVKMDESLPELDLAGYPNLYAPVGLDIGAETPEEIAASLVGEIVAVFRGRGGGLLRRRVGSIH